MNKTKRTLIVSSVVLTLIVIVTAISATAAWFSNIEDSSEDGFTIESALLQESASIDIDSKATGYGTALWPAIADPGYLAKGNVAPYGTDLKEKAAGKIDAEAKCAVIYFPINFVGSPDMKTDNGSQVAIDGRKSLCLQVEYAHLGTKSTADDGKETTTEDSGSKNYLSSFNVEMKLVSATKNGDTTTITDLPSATSPIGTVDQVYYEQPYTADALLPSYKLYMLVKPNTTYYVQATIYFNKIDEECDEQLLYLDAFQKANKAIVFKFEIKTELTDVNIREGIPSA